MGLHRLQIACLLSSACVACVLEDPYFIESTGAVTSAPATSSADPSPGLPTSVPVGPPLSGGADASVPGSEPGEGPRPPPSLVPTPDGASPLGTGVPKPLDGGPPDVDAPDASVETQPDAGADGASVPSCGDQVREGEEQCDGTDWGGADCSTLTNGEQPTGTLACSPECTFDTSGCDGAEATCGDGIAEANEGCDGADLRGQACTSRGFSGGSLRCSAGCELDESFCVQGIACDVVTDSRTGVIHRGDTAGMPSTLSTHSCTEGGRGGDVTIAWTAPQSRCYRVTITSDRDLDTIAAVYTSCGLVNEIACDDNSGSDQLSVLEFDAMVGTTYAIVVDSYFASDEGPVNVRVSPCAPPEWTCPVGYYGSGDGCDCGCGATDFDCGGDSDVGACDFCEAAGSCATSCAEVHAEENWHCAGP